MGADGFIFSGQREAIRHGELPQPTPDPDMAERAALGFAQAFPGQSAMSALTQPQVHVFRYVAMIAGVWGLIVPGLFVQLLMLVSLGLFGLILAFRVWLVATGCVLALRGTPALAVDVLLPVYTILIALKDEASSAAQLSRAMRGRMSLFMMPKTAPLRTNFGPLRVPSRSVRRPLPAYRRP